VWVWIFKILNLTHIFHIRNLYQLQIVLQVLKLSKYYSPFVAGCNPGILYFVKEVYFYRNMLQMCLYCYIQYILYCASGWFNKRIHWYEMHEIDDNLKKFCTVSYCHKSCFSNPISSIILLSDRFSRVSDYAVIP